MKKSWDPETPIEVIYNRIEEAIEISNQGNDLMSNVKKISIAYNLIKQTGELTKACCD